LTMPRITLNKILFGTATVVALVILPGMLKAVYVTPHAVFMTHGARAGQVTVGNSGESPEEVTVELRFGFPDTDSAGTPFIRFVEDPGPEFPSAEAWIRPYPRRLRLEPGEQQVVRLLATPPDDLPEGEYWTRMIVTGQGASAPIETADTTVRAGVSLVMRIITAVTYRKGHVTTGLMLREFEADVEGDSIAVWVDATRTGNGAYLGTVNLELVGSDGQQAGEWIIPIAVYYPMSRRFALPIASLAAGRYLLRLTIDSERPDLPDDDVLTAPTVSDSTEIVVP
jgi:hypothetical protein